MRRSPSHLADPYRAAAFAVALVMTPACNFGGSGGSGGYETQTTGSGGGPGGSSSGGGSSGGSGVDGTGTSTGAGVCEYNPQGACSNDADCCANVPRLPAAGSEAPGCTAGAVYPNRWECQDGTCVNLGCEISDDCVADGYQCLTSVDDNLPHCVHTCNPNLPSPCATLPNTSCVAGKVVGGASICFPNL